MLTLPTEPSLEHFSPSARENALHVAKLEAAAVYMMERWADHKIDVLEDVEELRSYTWTGWIAKADCPLHIQSAQKLMRDYNSRMYRAIEIMLGEVKTANRNREKEVRR